MAGCGFPVKLGDGWSAGSITDRDHVWVFSALDLYIIFVRTTAERQSCLHGRRPSRRWLNRSSRPACIAG
jgi:hypothetical protein